MKNFVGVKVLHPESAIRIETTPAKPQRDLAMLKALGVFVIAATAVSAVGAICAAFGLRSVAPIAGVLIGWFTPTIRLPDSISEFGLKRHTLFSLLTVFGSGFGSAKEVSL